MDSQQFDRLTRAFTTAQSRRTVLGSVLVVALALLSHAPALARKKKPCPPCRKRKNGKCKGMLPDGTACAAGTCRAGQCLAPPVVPPPPPPPAAPGCGAGGPCIVFLTSTIFPGNLGGLSGADTICQTLAVGAGLPGTYRAWLSDATGSVSTRFVPSSGPYQLINGARIAASFADLIDGTLLAPITVSETGGDLAPSSFVWTGTHPNGAVQPDATCANWTDGTDGRPGLRGRFAFMNANWTEWESSPCDALAHLYCFQQR